MGITYTQYNQYNLKPMTPWVSPYFTPEPFRSMLFRGLWGIVLGAKNEIINAPYTMTIRTSGQVPDIRHSEYGDCVDFGNTKFTGKGLAVDTLRDYPYGAGVFAQPRRIHPGYGDFSVVIKLKHNIADDRLYIFGTRANTFESIGGWIIRTAQYSSAAANMSFALVAAGNTASKEYRKGANFTNAVPTGVWKTYGFTWNNKLDRFTLYEDGYPMENVFKAVDNNLTGKFVGLGPSFAGTKGRLTIGNDTNPSNSFAAAASILGAWVMPFEATESEMLLLHNNFYGPAYQTSNLYNQILLRNRVIMTSNFAVGWREFDLDLPNNFSVRQPNG